MQNTADSARQAKSKLMESLVRSQENNYQTPNKPKVEGGEMVRLDSFFSTTPLMSPVSNASLFSQSCQPIRLNKATSPSSAYNMGAVENSKIKTA